MPKLYQHGPRLVPKWVLEKYEGPYVAVVLTMILAGVIFAEC
jgi:hypothetical protein